MGTEIRLTTGPTRLDTVGANLQALKDALDALAFNGMDLLLLCYETSGVSPSTVVTLETSMQNTSDDASLWKNVATFSAITASNTSDKQSITSGLLRYVRWTATLSANTSTFTFDLSGVARTG